MANETMYDEQAPRRRVHPLNWIGWVLAVLFLLVAGWLAYHSARVRRQADFAEGTVTQLQTQLTHMDRLVDVLISPDAEHIVLSENRLQQRPVGEVSWLASKGALIFVAGGLKPLPPGKTYALWLVPKESKAPLPAGLFRPNADGGATVVLPPLPADTQAERFLVTMEPETGSPTPSLPIVLQGR